MVDFVRGNYGQFAVKSDEPRKVRSVNLTQKAWDWLSSFAEEKGFASRNDLIEGLATGDNPFIEAEEKEKAEAFETLESLTAALKQAKEEVEKRDRIIALLKEQNAELDKEVGYWVEKQGDSEARADRLQAKLDDLTLADGREEPAAADYKEISRKALASLGLGKQAPAYKAAAKAIAKLIELMEG